MDFLECLQTVLPDNWGRLLLRPVDPGHISRLQTNLQFWIDWQLLEQSGMGVLTYYPEKSFSGANREL